MRGRRKPRVQLCPPTALLAHVPTARGGRGRTHLERDTREHDVATLCIGKFNFVFPLGGSGQSWSDRLGVLACLDCHGRRCTAYCLDYQRDDVLGETDQDMGHGTSEKGPEQLLTAAQKMIVSAKPIGASVKIHLYHRVPRG